MHAGEIVNCLTIWFQDWSHSSSVPWIGGVNDLHLPGPRGTATHVLLLYQPRPHTHAITLTLISRVYPACSGIAICMPLCIHAAQCVLWYLSYLSRSQKLWNFHSAGNYGRHRMTTMLWSIHREMIPGEASLISHLLAVWNQPGETTRFTSALSAKDFLIQLDLNYQLEV